MIACSGGDNEIEKPTSSWVDQIETEQGLLKDEIKPMVINQDLQKNKYIFDRYRFVNPETDWLYFNGETGAERGFYAYIYARKFMEGQVDEFNRAMQKEKNATFKQLANDLVANNPFEHNVSGSIDGIINKNNHNFGTLFGNMIYHLNDLQREQAGFCYQYLANRAYNDSLGEKAGTMETANAEIAKVKQELTKLDVQLNDQAVEDTLCGLLGDVAKQTGIAQGVLVRGVNLALYNEGLWGLRDLGGSVRSITTSPVYKPSGQHDGYDRYDIGNRTQNKFHAAINATLAILTNQQTNERGL